MYRRKKSPELRILEKNGKYTAITEDGKVLLDGFTSFDDIYRQITHTKKLVENYTLCYNVKIKGV